MSVKLRSSLCTVLLIRANQVLMVIIALSVASTAQIQNGQFTGVVMDPSGAVIPGATLTVKNLETGLTLTTISNDSGLYTAREVPIGSYKITVEAPGFKTVIKTGLILNAGTIQRVDFELPIGGQVETVEVVGGGETGVPPPNAESTALYAGFLLPPASNSSGLSPERQESLSRISHTVIPAHFGTFTHA